MSLDLDAIRAQMEDVHDDAEGTFKASEIRGLLDELDRAHAALARVEDVAERLEWMGKDHLSYWARQIRAALETPKEDQ
jgi:predicted  nucleic acid-binding Zn-ribbon protein